MSVSSMWKRNGAVMAVALGLGLSVAPATAAGPPTSATIEVLSNRADLVSGGDALVQVTLPVDVDPADVHVRLGARDVTDAFAVRSNGRLQGLVTGLETGDVTLTADLPRRRGASITITNHPIGGPVFAGPQVQPWICTTEEHGLGPAEDDQCNAPTVIDYQYKSAITGAFAEYDPADPPGDVATTTTDQGQTVPYIVRVETGTADRGIYQVAVLADPTQPWRPWAPQEAWNGKLLVPFGGDCAAHHLQTGPDSPATTPVLHDFSLSRGFAVAANGLNTLGNNCNEVVSAEALMLLKERIIETLGPIRYTIGWGGSGGAIQQHNIAGSYPGLLDGIVPTSSFPDALTTVVEVFDCGLLDRYFTATSPVLWPATAQRRFVEGNSTAGSGCVTWTTAGAWPQASDVPESRGFVGVLDPQNRGTGPSPLPFFSHGTWCGLPREQVYHPSDNPDGVRCDLWDYDLAVYGARPGDGFANRPVDNVGVQYGLQALTSGLITAEQFVDLNAAIGGYDIDLDWQPSRTEADQHALAAAYRAGRISDARTLAQVPIIDLRIPQNEEVHDAYHSYEMRARLDAANGTHANQVIWTMADSDIQQRGMLAMDRWLGAIEADTSDAPLADRIVRNRPADVVDSCWVQGRQVTDQSLCRAAFPYYANPRITAGGPLANDILKCQLTPLDRDDYPVAFTDAQWAALEAAFPTGVCDWRRPGLEQRPAAGAWLTYANGSGGRPLGDPPRSTPVRTTPQDEGRR